MSVAVGWGTWNNAAPATLTTQVLRDQSNPPGAPQVLRVAATGASCGIVQTFAQQDKGPARVISSAWVKVLRGRVFLGTGNGGHIDPDVHARPGDDWQLLSAGNGVAPANELVVYSAAPNTEFLIAHITCQEIPVADGKTAPLAALDPAGASVMVGYDVPQPMSHSGHNYIDLGQPAAAFLTVDVLPGTGLAPKAAAEPASDVLAAPTLHLPPGVRRAAGDDPGVPAIVTDGHRVTDRLSALTGADVRALAQEGKRVVVLAAVGGVFDYAVVDAPAPAVAAVAGLTAASAAAHSATQGADEGDGDAGDGARPRLTVLLATPKGTDPVHGTAAGVVVHISGTLIWTGTSTPSITVILDGASAGAAAVTGKRFELDVTITSSGTHAIVVHGAASFQDDQGATDYANDAVRADVNVTLDQSDGGDAATPPSVTVEHPGARALLLSQAEMARVTVNGATKCASGRSVTQVKIVEGGSTYTATPAGDGTWAADVALKGVGAHTMTVTATDSAGVEGSALQVPVTVSDQPPFRRLLNRLLLVETLNITSYLGELGAGSVIKTFSLLPGESATLSVKSYTKTSKEQKSASCILDSSATDSASDFQDSLTAEQSNTESTSEAQNYKVGASVSATWGWGTAQISADYSGSANAARQQAVKNVSNATQHHALKASTNRNVTVNTEYQVQQETGVEESSTRTIANINVSRTLNFVFRQVNQQHVTLIHLTNVRIAHYSEDLMLDADGNPAYQTDANGDVVTDPHTGAKLLAIRTNYREVPLADLDRLMRDAINPDYRQHIQQAVLNALSGIPDYQDRLRQAYEWVTPRADDGTLVTAARYMQFPRNLSTTFVDPLTETSFVVPGIVLDYDHVTLRTDCLLADSMLGPGNALDEYSRQLQLVALAERQVAIAERQAEVDREQLAHSIVGDADEAKAAIFAKLFPPPPAPIVSAVTASSDGTVVTGR